MVHNNKRITNASKTTPDGVFMRTLCAGKWRHVELMEQEYLVEFDVDMRSVKEHYARRKAVSEKLSQQLAVRSESEYVKLAVGVSDSLANYSANEHQLGPRILESNSIGAVFDLAQKLADPKLKVTHLPKTIYDANLPYLKIGVGSEIACLLQPKRFWVGNVRTIWSHLVIKHKGDWEKANEELALYRVGDVSSEMNYLIWRDIYLSMESSLDVIGRIAEIWAQEQNVKPGKLKYIWIDALCSALYEHE
jgi:hypothetical protein